MLKIISTHDMSEYLDILSSSLEIYMDEDRLQQAFEEVAYTAEDMRKLATLWLRIESAGAYPTLSTDNIEGFLYSIGVNMDKYKNRRTGRVSLDKKKVLDPLMKAGVAPEFLKHYIEYKTYKSYTSTFTKLIENRKYHGVTSDGHVLVKFPTHVDEQDNMRAYYSDIAVVSVPKLYSKIITGPSDNYYIAWCDYPQADWRFAYNLFIRGDDNEQIMRGCTDAYEGLGRLVLGDKFDAEQFKKQRADFKLHCLSVFYNSNDNAPIPSAIRTYFQSRPKYRKMLFDLYALYQFKMRIPCTSYFGFTQMMPEGSYPREFVSKALNTPIQTFTSHIVNETVFNVLEKFRALGYTKEDINIYYVRHDEPLFLFTEKVVKDAWIFADCQDIYIPGFTPIKLDFYYGRYYKEEDSEITAKIADSVKANASLITHYREEDHVSETVHDYNPFPTVESIYVQLYGIGTADFCLKALDYRTWQTKVFYPKATELDDAINEVFSGEGLDWLGHPEYLLVRNGNLDYMNRVGEGAESGGGTLMKVVMKYDGNAATALSNL